TGQTATVSAWQAALFRAGGGTRLVQVAPILKCTPHRAWDLTSIPQVWYPCRRKLITAPHPCVTGAVFIRDMSFASFHL
ncbi:hypothetical protein D6833_03105, partial [Candidatus Parcubacteria bacterium]